jgi:hypothetical protein
LGFLCFTSTGSWLSSQFLHTHSHTCAQMIMMHVILMAQQGNKTTFLQLVCFKIWNVWCLNYSLLATGARASLRVTLFEYILFGSFLMWTDLPLRLICISYQKIIYHFYVPVTSCNAFCFLSFNDHISFLFSLNLGEIFSSYSYLTKYF